MIPQLHLLNWGMGIESTAILVRWMLEPQSRPFHDFQSLIVLTAQTGDEMDETKYLCETYLFPLMREHKVRLVQIAKASASKRDGYIILSDNHQPSELHTEGYFSLSRDLLQSGTVPRLGRPHICAQRWKGEVLDAWITDHVTEAFGPYSTVVFMQKRSISGAYSDRTERSLDAVVASRTSARFARGRAAPEKLSARANGGLQAASVESSEWG